MVDRGASPISINAAIIGLKFFFNITLVFLLKATIKIRYHEIAMARSGNRTTYLSPYDHLHVTETLNTFNRLIATHCLLTEY